MPDHARGTSRNPNTRRQTGRRLGHSIPTGRPGGVNQALRIYIKVDVSMAILEAGKSRPRQRPWIDPLGIQLEPPLDASPPIAKCADRAVAVHADRAHHQPLIATFSRPG